MNEKEQFPEVVMLIDAAYLNIVIADFKKNFEQLLQRSLQDIDLARLLTYFALDASVPTGDNEVQVILTYDSKTEKILHCYPADLKKELNGVAFQGPLGEFSLATASSEEITLQQELYLDLLQLLGESDEVKKIILIPFSEEYGEEATVLINEMKNKEIVWLGMNQPTSTTTYRWEMLAYPIMQALGIKGDEIQ